MLRHVLPESLINWIDDHHISMGPQPYPLIKQLWQYLLPLASKKLIIDSSLLNELEEISQPQNFALVWRINSSLMCIEGVYEDADRYLGMGWFQKETKIWPLKKHPTNTLDTQLRNLILPIQQAKYLLHSLVPNLQQYLPTRIDFRLISNFALEVIVLDARYGGITLALECNYPQFLPTIQVPQQRIDVLFANQAIIQFPYQALTPVLIKLLQSGSSITIQGVGVPFFIHEQLPVMRHFYQISNDMEAKIIQFNPVVPIATLKPTLSLIHTYENGVGKYTIAATYQYQQQQLDISAFLTARRYNQRFVQQHAAWFEWPYDSHELANNIQHQQTMQVLRPVEIMGFDTQRTTHLSQQPNTHMMRPSGMTPIERSASIFKQLRYHGIPGGIVGEPKGMLTMFINACEYVLRDNRQAHILWLAPSNKKGSVTRAVHDTTSSSNVTVASFVTLRNEPALLTHPWTLVIFQGLDILLDDSPQSRMLSHLKWQWALTSVTSVRTLSPFIMQILHLPERYFAQFCDQYLFNLEGSFNSEVTGRIASGLNTYQPASPNVPKSAPTPQRRTIKLNQTTIARLHEESEQLHERLSVDDEGGQEQLSITPIPDQVPVTVVVRETAGPASEVDDDWKIILQQWQPEHWEVISLLYQMQSAQLTTVGRKARRPVSQLIDEINSPVDEQLGDLLIDPETQTLSPHLHGTAENLVRWYFSSKDR